MVAKVLAKVFDQVHERVAGLDVHKAQATPRLRPGARVARKARARSRPSLTTVLDQRLGALHAQLALCRDLTRTGLQQPRTSQCHPFVHSGSDALIGGDALAQLTGAQRRRGRGIQRQARIEPGQREA